MSEIDKALGGEVSSSIILISRGDINLLLLIILHYEISALWRLAVARNGMRSVILYGFN